MKNQNSMQPDGVFRNSALITGRMRKSAHTYIAGAIGMAAVTAVDSLIAGIRIGESALAANRSGHTSIGSKACPAARKGEPF